ncbi:malonate decarboxylase subunit epsilon [Massilia sp. GCM10023247]|uniref:malonate decarboxylase subunit epsilon n=1 Tax=Massilia sp. GCM10023247 TaxID=3252643 RepID=UPI003618E68B
MSVMLTFPGQGSQRAGMLHRLPDHPEAARTLAEAGAVLGTDPLALDTPGALASSRAVQLCLLVAGVAMARTLTALGARPAMVAGLSIGAFPAAVVAGALDYADAVALVARRGKLMDDAYPVGHGMAAIVGLGQQQVEALIAQVHARDNPVYLANLNAPQQFVISGADSALEAVAALARAQGASKAERLAVSVPSHCELFDQAAEDMRAAFAGVELRRPRIIFLSSSAARRLSDPERIAEDLATNMARQVHWAETARLAWERGARLAVEMPSGLTLTSLTAPLFSEGVAIGCDNTPLETILALGERFTRS